MGSMALPVTSQPMSGLIRHVGFLVARAERVPRPGRPRRGTDELWADALDEALRRRPAPLGDERLVRRQQMRATSGVQAVGVGPALVHPAPGVCPVVIDLAAKQM